VLWLLEEIGEPFEIKQLDMSGRERQPLSRDQPLGKVPALCMTRRDHRGRGDLLPSRRRLPAKRLAPPIAIAIAGPIPLVFFGRPMEPA